MLSFVKKNKTVGLTFILLSLIIEVRKAKLHRKGRYQMTRQGNEQHMTYNLGHDVAKTRLATKLNIDIYSLRKVITQHVEIKFLMEHGAVKIGKIIGQNFTIGAVDSLLSEYRPVNAINKDVTVIQQVNNIVTSIVRQFTGSKDYGKTSFWKNLDSKKYTYCKRITVGADILSLDWIKKNYSRSEFTCKLDDKSKMKKYNNWRV